MAHECICDRCGNEIDHRNLHIGYVSIGNGRDVTLCTNCDLPEHIDFMEMLERASKQRKVFEKDWKPGPPEG